MSDRQEIMTRLGDALADLYLHNPPEFAGEVAVALFHATGIPGWAVANARLGARHGRLQAVPEQRSDGSA